LPCDKWQGSPQVNQSRHNDKEREGETMTEATKTGQSLKDRKEGRKAKSELFKALNK